MTILEVVETVDTILNIGIAESVSPEEDKIAKYQQDGDAASIVSCCNCVLEELYRDNFADCHTTVVEAKEGKIDVSRLKILRILALRDAEGNKVRFMQGEGCLYAPYNGKFNLTYARAPAEVDLLSDLPANPRMTFRIFIYGVITEYLRRRGDFNQSLSWDEKYRNALSAAATAPQKTMPVRRWI